MGPGRFGLPTSRLSGVRSNQLSYEPLHPTSAALPNHFSLNWFERRFILVQLKKSNKKTAAFHCQRFINLNPGFLSAVKASAYRLSGLVPKLGYLSQVMNSSPTDSDHSTSLSASRQDLFSLFARDFYSHIIIRPLAPPVRFRPLSHPLFSRFFPPFLTIFLARAHADTRPPLLTCGSAAALLTCGLRLPRPKICRTPSVPSSKIGDAELFGESCEQWPSNEGQPLALREHRCLCAKARTGNQITSRIALITAHDAPQLL